MAHRTCTGVNRGRCTIDTKIRIAFDKSIVNAALRAKTEETIIKIAEFYQLLSKYGGNQCFFVINLTDFI